jgi:RNA polymerase sigma-70 factor (ECF subfamily)
MNMDLERFKTEIIPLRQKLFLFACRMTENEEDAEDVVQETFLKLWKIREQLGDMANPKGFAMQTAKNCCIDKLRERKETVEADDFYLGTTDSNPYSDLELADSVAIIKRIIEQLPELQQCIIRMRDIEGYELQDIADITGIQIRAVAVNLSRARKKVRDRYLNINSVQLKRI